MYILVVVLIGNGFAAADSVVAHQSLLDIEISAIELLEVSYNYEIELGEHKHCSVLFSGGPFLYSDSFFDSHMWGIGVGAEFRRYKSEGYNGLFVSGVTRADLKWASGENRVESVCAGISVGWKCNLKDTGVLLDLEPSFNLGLSVDNAGYDGWEFDPDGYIGLGLGLGIH